MKQRGQLLGFRCAAADHSVGALGVTIFVGVFFYNALSPQLLFGITQVCFLSPLYVGEFFFCNVIFLSATQLPTTMADEFDVILEGDEAEVLDVGLLEVEPGLKEDVWLLGKVLTRGRVPPGPFRMTLRNLWESRNCEEVRHVGKICFRSGSRRQRTGI